MYYYISYTKKVTQPGKLLGKHSLKPSASQEEIQEIIHSSKDDKISLALSAIYRIPCSCGKIYWDHKMQYQYE